MDLRLTREQLAFRDDVRSFIRERLPESMREHLRRGHPPRHEDIRTWQRILNERGWAAPHWPKEYGGAGLGIAERLILLNEIYRAPAPLPSMFNIFMLGPVLLRYGTDDQRSFFLPKLANLDLWFCQGFSEPGAGSDLAALRTSARRDGDYYIVTGQKIWTSTAHIADWIFALVRTDGSSKKQDGISFLMMDMRTPGITVRPIVSIDGHHHLNEVFFDEVRVPATNLVGEEGRGWEVAKYLLANERTGIANVGMAWERLDYALELAGTTVRAGRRLIDDPKLRADIVLLQAELRAMELTNWRFLMDADIARKTPGFASVLKLKATEVHQDISALLQRIAGAQGMRRFESEGEEAFHPLAGLTARYLYYRSLTILGGTSEIQKDILAKTLVT